MAFESTYAGDHILSVHLVLFECIILMLYIFQDDRTCWMEAILAGSSAVFKPVTPESQYEPVTPIPDSELYSYARMSRTQEHHHHTQERKDLKSLYDDPEAPIMIQAQIPSHSQPIAKDTPTPHLEHPSQARARRARSKSPSKPPLPTTERVVPDSQKFTRPPASPLRSIHMTISDDKEQYDLVDVAAGTEPIEEYVDVDEQTSPLHVQAKSPRRSVTVPKELSALAELSAENLSSMDPNDRESQLWLLNQMQKLVEKLAGVYESTTVGPLPKSQRGKVLPAQLQDIEEVYDNVQTEPPSHQTSRKISRQPKTVYASPTSSTNTKLLAAERSPRHQSAAAYIHRPPIRPKPGSSGKLYNIVT